MEFWGLYQLKSLTVPLGNQVTIFTWTTYCTVPTVTLSSCTEPTVGSFLVHLIL